MAAMARIFLVLPVLIAVAGQDGNSLCPPGYVHNRDSCYKLFPLAVTWPEAVVFCKTFGAQLAKITDQTEQDYVKGYISGLNGSLTQDVWLGGSDLLVDGEWQWTSTQQMIGYTNWQPGEPNNYGGSEDCLALAPWSSYLWNDAPCTSKEFFLCEIELGTSPIG